MSEFWQDIRDGLLIVVFAVIAGLVLLAVGRLAGGPPEGV